MAKQKIRLVRNKVSLDIAFEKPDMTITEDYRPSAPEVPLQVFSKRWQQSINVSSKVKGCSVDYAMVSILVGAASVIGNARRVQAWEGFEQPCILWGMHVGLPSTNKSPALDIVKKPLMCIESEFVATHEEQLKEWKANCEVSELHFNAWTEQCKKALKAGKEFLPVKPKEAEKPKRPARTRLVVIDLTVEALRNVLADNPRGVLMLRDELAGLIKNFMRYGGSDKEAYLSAYDGDAYSADRVGYENTVHVPSFSVSLLGGIQPEKLEEELKHSPDDGFFARFLVVNPIHQVQPRPDVKPDNDFILAAFNKLRMLEMGVDENNVPISKVIKLRNVARNVFDEWKMQIPELEKDTNGILTSFIGKTPGMVLRLSLVLEYLSWVEKDGVKELEYISIESIENAITLIMEYFIPMSRRVFYGFAVPSEEMDARLVAKYILKQRPEKINFTKFYRMQGAPIRERLRLAKAIDYLIECKWLYPLQEREGDTPGCHRKNYVINPRLYEFI